MLLTLCFAPSALHAQIIESVDGKFHLCADDSAVVFVNGKEVFKATFTVGQSEGEPPMVLKLGDHVVFQLHNKGGPKGLFAEFVASDAKTMIHFPRTAYKMPRAPSRPTTDAEFREGRSIKDIKTAASACCRSSRNPTGSGAITKPAPSAWWSRASSWGR